MRSCKKAPSAIAVTLFYVRHISQVIPRSVRHGIGFQQLLHNAVDLARLYH